MDTVHVYTYGIQMCVRARECVRVSVCVWRVRVRVSVCYAYTQMSVCLSILYLPCVSPII
jgi:hypothetical protein